MIRLRRTHQLFFLLLISCSRSIHAQEVLSVDPQATRETIHLYKNLRTLLHTGVMFGHQDALAYGVNWKYIAGRSDIKDVTGDYPAVYGWELGGLENDKSVNLDSVPFDKMRSFIRSGYERGGLITISWHLNNLLTGKSAWDTTSGAVRAALPGGEKHDLYKSWLDKLALFFNSLKGKNNEFIPVIFRPFHELNGGWFWWGKGHCTPKEIQELYRFTASYLRNKKNIHHLLYAFNTDKFSSRDEYLERYPGDEWVDILGFDIYQRGTGAEANEHFIRDAGNMLTIIENIASAGKRIPAITEFGFNALPDSTWWTKVLLKAISGHKISYVLAWRNAGPENGESAQFYAPYKGHSSENDFIKFYNTRETLFEKDVAKRNLYNE